VYETYKNGAAQYEQSNLTLVIKFKPSFHQYDEKTGQSDTRFEALNQHF